MVPPKDDAETAELQKYIEGILKPTNEDIDLAIQLVCSAPDRHKYNGFKSMCIVYKITFCLHLVCYLFLIVHLFLFKVHLSNEDINKYAFTVYRKKQKLAQMEKNLMMQLLTRDFRQRRVEQLERLKEWEDEINATTQGKPPVKIENNVDLDEPPSGFTYVSQCKVCIFFV